MGVALHLMEVSAMSYKCIYCVFTLYGRYSAVAPTYLDHFISQTEPRVKDTMQTMSGALLKIVEAKRDLENIVTFRTGYKHL